MLPLHRKIAIGLILVLCVALGTQALHLTVAIDHALLDHLVSQK